MLHRYQLEINIEFIDQKVKAYAVSVEGDKYGLAYIYQLEETLKTLDLPVFYDTVTHCITDGDKTMDGNATLYICSKLTGEIVAEISVVNSKIYRDGALRVNNILAPVTALADLLPVHIAAIHASVYEYELQKASIKFLSEYME